jgi:hypothetical protein
MASVHTAPAIDFSQRRANHGSYKYTRVLPQQSTVTLNETSQTEILVDLPNRVYNLSKSTFECEVNIPASGVVGSETQLFTCGQSLLRRCSLYTRSGVFISDIQNVQLFTRAVAPLVTSVEKQNSYDKCEGSNSVAVANQAGRASFNCASRGTISNATLLGPDTRRFQADGTSDSPSVAQTEQKYLTAASDVSALALAVSVPLSELCPHTIMSLDRDTYYNQSLVLRLGFAPYNAVAQTATGDAAGNAVLPAPSAPVLSNIRVNLAIETNSNIANGIRQRVMSQGITELVPYVYENTYTSPANSSELSHQIRYNSSHGHSLLCLYTATADGRTSLAANLDIDNRGSAKVTSYQASVDNNLLTEFRPDCTRSEDYMLQRHIMEGSVAAQSANVFQYNRTLAHSWRAGKSKDWTKTDNVVDGMDLSAERIFNIDKTVVAGPAYRNLAWAIVQRRMTIAPTGDVIMS